MDFKRKYHGNAYRSEFYAAIERAVKSQIEAVIAANALPLDVVELGVGVGKSGIVEGFSTTEQRFDLAVVRRFDKALVCFVEVTGDSHNDGYARILTEKLEKMEELFLKIRIPIFVAYVKRSKNGTIKKLKFFDTPTLLAAYRFGCDNPKACFLDLWLENEKPYLFIDLRYAFDARSFAARIKNLVKGIGKEVPKITIEELLRR